jgi:hypothetical protein
VPCILEPLDQAVSDAIQYHCSPRRNKFVVLTVLLSVASLLSLQLEQRSGLNVTARTLGNHGNENRTSTTGVLARAFDLWPSDQAVPCELVDFDGKSSKLPTKTGFLFLKPFKTGSSTSAGINLRIARNMARRQQTTNNSTNSTICKASFDHGPQPFPAFSMFSNRSVGNSFLWTVIREPTERVVSAFFHFEVSRKKQEPSDAKFLNYISSKNMDYYLRSLHPSMQFDRDHDDPIQAANEILREYDFIGITERLDESAVVLMMLMDLKMADVLYLTAKSNGGYDAGSHGKCTFIQPSFLTEGMQEALNNDTWQDRVQHDQALYQAANESLDLTIDQLGRENFEKKLESFRQARRFSKDWCLSNATFPCQDGRFVSPKDTDCLWKDSGCGMTCLDEVSDHLGLW